LAALPSLGRPAPAFTLTDADGKARSLSEWEGRPVALFFFCGCSWCAEVAKEWGLRQREQGPNGAAPPLTVIVYSGDAAEAKALAKESGLDARATVLLCDPDLRVTQDIYHSEPCPRVFVLDGQRTVRYVNAGPDDRPREAPAAVIAAKALAALRGANAPFSAAQREAGNPGDHSACR
jgi:peroxiredoxin